MKSRLNSWTILCLTGLAAHTMVDEWLRPKYGTGESLLSDLLGVAPNLLSASLIFPFAFQSIFLGFRRTQSTTDTKELRKYFRIAILSTVLGLIAWEFMQLTGNLVFDWNDIWATILAAAVTLVMFEALHRT